MEILRQEEALALLAWAEKQNPGPWAAHCRNVARAAERIAAHCGMDADRAYILGLLHDIGRYEGVRAMHHVLAGYQLMMEQGQPLIARACLTHSFPVQDLAYYSGVCDCTPQEVAQLEKALAACVYDAYDGLIQLCDALAGADGIGTMEARLLDVAARHGANEFSQAKWAAFYALKQSFSARAGQNIYGLFREEIGRSVFGD